MRYVTIGLTSVLTMLWLVKAVFAADPLPVIIRDGQAFRHVLETDDWLFLARVYKTPDTSTGNTDTFTVSTTSGDFDDPVVFTNRVEVTTAVDFTVEANGTTDITSFCTLGQDDQTIDCTGTALADASHSIVVNYRMGWNAYVAGDVLVRAATSTPVIVEAPSAAGTYTLAGLYMTAAQVTASGATWGDSAITLNALASPNLWDTPADVSVAIAWCPSCSDADATETALTAEIQQYLVELELDDPAVSTGVYVGTSGITLTGFVVAARAFSRIQFAIPQAFSSFEANVFPTPFTTSASSAVDAIETARNTTAVYTSFQNIHPSVGGLITFLLSIIVAGWLWVKFKSTEITGTAWVGIIVAGWLIFNVPFQIPFIIGALVIALGFQWIGKLVFD